LTKPRGTRFPLQLTVFDRQGKVVRTLGEPGNYWEARLSPDGTQVAAMLDHRDIRVFDISTGKSTQVTSSAAVAANYQSSPVWSPDGLVLLAPINNYWTVSEPMAMPTSSFCVLSAIPPWLWSQTRIEPKDLAEYQGEIAFECEGAPFRRVPSIDSTSPKFSP